MRLMRLYGTRSASWRQIGLAATLAAIASLAALPALASPPRVRWTPSTPAPAIVDLTAPRSDGRLIAAIGRRLWTLDASGTLRRFARGSEGYLGPAGGEPYIALARRASFDGAGCAFHRDDVYAIDPIAPGVVRITARGEASRFAELPGGTPTGIAFDQAGDFGHRLLVVAATGSTSTLYRLGCDAQVTVLADDLPAGLEGGMAVAPRGFGDFGGDLVAPIEPTGEVYAIDSAGTSSLVAKPDLPTGRDIGVGSLGFIPRHPKTGHALVADRLTEGDAQPGTGSILSVSLGRLRERGARPGDLLAVTEAGARTARVRCAAACSSREVAAGPSVAHVEGHVSFLPGPRANAAQG